MGQKRAGSPSSVAAKRAKLSKSPKTEAKSTVDSYPPAKTSSQHQQDDAKSGNSDIERDKLLKWLHKAEIAGKDPFRIRYPARKGKKSKPHTGPTQSLRIGEKDLPMTVEYFVDPQTKWSRLSKYRKFTVGGNTYAVGEVVLVKHTEDKAEQQIDLRKQWKALVLEVRAFDENHVFLRVIYLENPEDLPGGRKRYHGNYELVPSNDMSIIDAMTVNGGIKVKHWDDADDTSKVPEEDEFFWRQVCEKDFTLGEGAGQGKLSALHKICVCEEPHNPDEKIIHCEGCNMWLHTTCIAEAAVKRAQEDTDEDTWTEKPQTSTDIEEPNAVEDGKSTKSKAKTKRKSKIRQSNGGSSEDPATNAFTATVEASNDATPRIIVEDVKGARRREEQVKCLQCSEVIV